MKNRRQSKLAKSAKKSAVAHDDSSEKLAKTNNKEKDSKKNKKNQNVCWEATKTDKANDQEIKRARITTKVKDITGKDSNRACNKITQQTALTHVNIPQTSKLSKTSKTKTPLTNEIGEGEKALDVQTYLDTLPSEEIRVFIKGLIAEDKFNMLPVNTSAIIGNMDMMENYFKKDSKTGKSKYDANGRCLDGGTPLHTAIKAKNKQSVKLLLQNGADCSMVDFMGDNAIMAAIKAGDATVINTLWPYRGSLNVDHSNMLGMTALHLAAERSWEACTSFLLQNRASPNIANGSGVTPLMIAASKGDLNVVECLVRGEADVCVEDGEYNTSISRAFAEKHQRVVDFLLRQLNGEKYVFFIQKWLAFLATILNFLKNMSDKAEYNTSISRAFTEKHQRVVDFLLRQLNGEKYVFFIRDLMDNIMHPPLPEKDYALIEQRYLPLLVECTKYGGFRYAFYSTNVVHKITVKLEDSLRDIEGSIQTANLILCTFFKFGDEINKYFVKQFLKCKGPDLIIHMVHFYTNDWKISEKDSIFVFLPMIGLVELPEGRAWLSKNVITVSEYFNLFEKDQLKVYISHSSHHQWCLEQKFFKEINRVWIAFYNEIQKEQTFQRERHIAELLEQEERERDKKERRLVKMKQKLHEKELESPLAELWTIESKEEQLQDKGCSNLNANSSRNGFEEWDYIGTLSKQNAVITTEAERSLTKYTHDIGELVHKFRTVKDETWTTVCTKKQKEKQSKDKITHKQDKKRKKESRAKPFPLENFSTQTPLKFTGSARWADVAKGINKKPSSPNEDAITTLQKEQHHTNRDAARTFGQTDFPSLDGNPGISIKQEKLRKMTFHFHGAGELANETEADYLTDGSIDTDQIDKELDATLEYELHISNTDSDVNEADIAGERCNIHQEHVQINTANDHSLTNSTTEQITNVTDGRAILSHPNNSYESTETEHAHDINHYKPDVAEMNISSGLEKLAIIGDNPELNREKYIRTRTPSMHEQIQYQGEEDRMTEYQTDTSKLCRYTRKTENNTKSAAVVSINDGAYVDTETNIYDSTDNSFNTCQHNESIEDQMQQLISGGILSHREVKVFQNQTETFKVFEEMLNEYDSDPFMDLSEALQYIGEDEGPEELSVIDEMFGSPSHIPENIEEENEDLRLQREHVEPQLHNMANTNVIVSANFVQMQTSAERGKELQTFADIHPYNVHQSPSRDLVASDPAIIHCVNTQLSSKPKNSEGERQCIIVQQSMGQNLQVGARSNDNGFAEDFVTMDCTTVGSEGNIRQVNDDLDLESIQKQTAVITPLKNVDGSLYPSVNCQLGDTILKTACQLAHRSDIGSYEELEELDGELVELDIGKKSVANDTKDRYDFPYFHADTKLSCHYNTSDISVAHRMQQVQHQQLSNYYTENQNKIHDVNSWQQTKFTYYAQAAGMDKEYINRHLEGHHDTDKVLPSVNNSKSITEQNAFVHQDGKIGIAVNMNEQLRRRSCHADNTQQTGIGYENTELPVTGYQHVQMTIPSAQPFGHIQQQHPRVGLVQAAPVALFPMVPYGLAGPMYQPPPTHPANIRNIQTQQAAMSQTVKNKIDDILTSMFNAKIKSVRWRQELDNLRTLPTQKLQVIGKILIPKRESDRQYIAYHYTGSTILGYMLDGSEVAVKITSCLYRPFKPEDIDRLMGMETACHQFVNKYRAIEVLDGFFYIATDLFEYTLPEYLCKINKQTMNELDLIHVKMVFQLLRGISTLHQQYLIVHAELRPDNILIDLEGNLKIGGYGFGRNVDRDTQFLEYNDEDKCWLAPEVLVHKQKISFKSDIWTAGMLIYYIFKEGQNPYGSEPHEIICNISDQSYKLEKVGEELDHLIGMMLSLNRTERPAVSEALKHPLFWAEEKRMRFINIVGSDIVRELRGTNMMDNSSESMLSILARVPCNINIVRWMHDIDPVVIREMKSFRNYKNNFIDLVVFVFNCCNHFDTLSSRVREVIDEPCNYFLVKFPSLLMMVHRAVKASDKKDKPCYKPFF